MTVCPSGLPALTPTLKPSVGTPPTGARTHRRRVTRSPPSRRACNRSNSRRDAAACPAHGRGRPDGYQRRRMPGSTHRSPASSPSRRTGTRPRADNTATAVAASGLKPETFGGGADKAPDALVARHDPMSCSTSRVAAFQAERNRRSTRTRFARKRPRVIRTMLPAAKGSITSGRNLGGVGC